MSKLLVQDKKGELESVAKNLILNEKTFKTLKNIVVLFVWRLGESARFDDEGRQIAATTRRLPTRERDIYGFDVEIEVFKQSWRRLSTKKKKRLMWHELQHIEIEQGENFKIARDDDGRVVLHIRPHDVVITAFEDELKKYGLANKDVPDVIILTKALKKRKKKKTA